MQEIIVTKYKDWGGGSIKSKTVQEVHLFACRYKREKEKRLVNLYSYEKQV